MIAFEYNLKRLLETEQLRINELNKSLGEDKNSKLYIRRRKGNNYYTKSTNHKEVEITGNAYEIEKLLRIEKAQLDLKVAENNYCQLSGCLQRLQKINRDTIERYEPHHRELEKKTGIKFPLYAQNEWIG